MKKKPQKAKKAPVKQTRAKKMQSLSQAHGKEEQFKPTTLDQIWGDDGTSEYQTMDANVYKGQLDDMNKSDLQNHASKRGLVPVDDRRLLTERLIEQFRKHVNQYRIPQDLVDNSYDDLDPEIRKILGEGK